MTVDAVRGVAVSILAFQACVPGSTPGGRTFFVNRFSVINVSKKILGIVNFSVFTV